MDLNFALSFFQGLLYIPEFIKSIFEDETTAVYFQQAKNRENNKKTRILSKYVGMMGGNYTLKL